MRAEFKFFLWLQDFDLAEELPQSDLRHLIRKQKKTNKTLEKMVEAIEKRIKDQELVVV